MTSNYIEINSNIANNLIEIIRNNKDKISLKIKVEAIYTLANILKKNVIIEGANNALISILDQNKNSKEYELILIGVIICLNALVKNHIMQMQIN